MVQRFPDCNTLIRIESKELLYQVQKLDISPVGLRYDIL